MKKYDVVVIGAGNGGLAGAVRMLMAGKSVLVCEKHNLPGGFATSFVRGRFEFEASLHEFNGIGTPDKIGSTGEMFQELGVADKIEWIQLKDAYRLISKKEGYDFTMPFGVEAFAQANEKLIEGGAGYIRHFFAICQQIREALAYISQSHGRPDPQVLMEKYGDYVRCSSYSIEEAFDALGYPQIIRDNLNAYWCYLGSPTDQMSFMQYANMIYSYFEGGAVIPRGRSHEISLAFDTRIRELGGDIWYNTEVTKILTDQTGHVCGVQLADGAQIEANYVLANCSPHVVYGKLLDKDAVPERARKLTNARKFAGRGFTAFLGLSKSPDELGITDHNYFIYDTCNSAKQYETMKCFGKNTVQATVCLNHGDPNCSPKGTTILYMTTLFTDDVWSQVEEKDYFTFKNDTTKALIARFEEATGCVIHDCIEEIAVATPQTYARYCGHPQGVIYGYEGTYNDCMMARIQMVEEDRFVAGLRIAGGFGERLLGYPSSFKSGVNEANRLLKDMTKEGA